MNATKASIILGALLSASRVLAQAPATTQASDGQAPAGQAQAGNNKRNFDPAKQADHLGQRLGLTTDQVAQIKPILADRFEKMQTLRADTSLSQQDRHAKAKAIMQDANGRIEALLNDTQKQEYQQMLAQRHSRQHNRQTQPSA
jgi:periplasmic protein CpxP/Spy